MLSELWQLCKSATVSDIIILYRLRRSRSVNTYTLYRLIAAYLSRVCRGAYMYACWLCMHRSHSYNIWIARLSRQHKEGKYVCARLPPRWPPTTIYSAPPLILKHTANRACTLLITYIYGCAARTLLLRSWCVANCWLYIYVAGLCFICLWPESANRHIGRWTQFRMGFLKHYGSRSLAVRQNQWYICMYLLRVLDLASHKLIMSAFA